MDISPEARNQILNNYSFWPDRISGPERLSLGFHGEVSGGVLRGLVRRSLEEISIPTPTERSSCWQQEPGLEIEKTKDQPRLRWNVGPVDWTHPQLFQYLHDRDIRYFVGSNALAEIRHVSPDRSWGDVGTEVPLEARRAILYLHGVREGTEAIAERVSCGIYPLSDFPSLAFRIFLSASVPEKWPPHIFIFDSKYNGPKPSIDYTDPDKLANIDYRVLMGMRNLGPKTLAKTMTALTRKGN